MCIGSIRRISVSTAVAVSVLFFGLPANAGQQIDLPVQLDSMPGLQVTLTPLGDGNGGEEGGAPRGQCPQQQRTYTLPGNFQGGTFNLQGGLVETEIMAASYVQPATDFPLRIDMMEFVIGTQAATVQTTTEYTFLVWEGPPNTGNLIFEFSSDDVILPHARVGPGTAGLNIQGSVDPGDPDQIIVQDNGSHTFTIGLRIDSHNNPPTSTCPCVPGFPGFGTLPAVCCPPLANQNAFPATDTDGVSNPTNNWLFARDCPGATGVCQASPGWHRFNEAGLPSGDWVMRATFTPFICPGQGACCNPTTGVCQIQTEADCENAGNNWSGEGTGCSPNNCPQPTGACCRLNGTCSENVIINSCAAQGEVFHQNLTCAQVTCQQPEGACCTNDSGAPCVVVDSSTCATVYNGFWKGAFTDCVTNACNGACCFSNGNCLFLNKPQCGANQFQGVGVACQTGNLCPKGACCFVSGACTLVTEIDCNSQGGDYQGTGVTCQAANCPQPFGACCFDGTCLELIETDCAVVPNGTWSGPGTTCATSCQAPIGACCYDGTECLELTQADCGFLPESSWSGPDTECASSCQSPCTGDADGDMNEDNDTDGEDVHVFTTALIDGGTPSQVCRGDFNDSLTLDVGDVDGMVNALLSGP